MKRKILYLLPLAAMTLVACETPSSSSSMKDSSMSDSSSSISVDPNFVPPLLTPSGAPTLALFDMGDEENWDSTTKTATIPAAFQTPGYDAIIFDGVNGLNNLKKNQNDDFFLARWLTGGNFHLVSLTEEEFNASSPITIFSFSENGLPDLVFKHLLETWDVDTSLLNIEYGSGVQDVATALQSQADYDYFFIAEPVLTASKNALNGKAEVHEIFDLREEWEKETGQVALPQAALFLRKSAYNANSASFDAFLDHIDANLEASIHDVAKVQEEMNAYSSAASDQQGRWGFNANIIGLCQANEENRIGMIEPGSIEDNADFVNTFGEVLYGEDFVPYDASFFL